MTAPSISRDALLDAAEAVVLEMGARRRQQGRAALYLASGDALLPGMVSRLCNRLEAAQTALPKDGNTAADNLKAHVIATFAEDANTRNGSASLLAVVANDPQLLAPVHQHQQRDLSELWNASRSCLKIAAVLALARAAESTLTVSI